MLRIELFRKRPVFVWRQDTVALCPAVRIVHHTPGNINVISCGGNSEMNEKTEVCLFKKPAGTVVFVSFKGGIRCPVTYYIMLPYSLA